MSTGTRTRSGVTNRTPDPLDQIQERLQRLSRFEDQLWTDCPEVITARARAGRLNAATAAVYDALRGGQTDVATVVGAAFDRALDGGHVDPDTLRADLTAAYTAGQAAETAAAVLPVLAEQARLSATTIESDHADEALQHLNGVLQNLVGVARQLLQVADHDDGGDLAGVGRAAQANVLLERAAETHDRIRTTQQGLSASPETADPAEAVRAFGILRDPSGFEPFASALRGPEAVSDRTRLADLAREGGITLLRVVCGGEPWCPTRPQLRAAASVMSERVEQARYATANPNTAPQLPSSGSSPVITGAGMAVTKSVPSRSAQLPTTPPAIPSRTLGAGGQRQRR